MLPGWRMTWRCDVSLSREMLYQDNGWRTLKFNYRIICPAAVITFHQAPCHTASPLELETKVHTKVRSQSRTIVWSSVSASVTAPPATAACDPRSRTTRGPRVSGREDRQRQPAHCRGHPILSSSSFCLVMCRHQYLELHVVKSVVEAPFEEVGIAIAILQGSVNVVWTFGINCGHKMVSPC